VSDNERGHCMRGARRLIAIPVLAAALLLVGWVGSAQAATWFVGPGDSIQAAVDGASPGDTIFVFGAHSENVLIQTDGLKLKGLGATLTPGAENECGANGFCVVGDINFEDFVVNSYIQDVSISGFEISGFEDSGILAFGAQNASFSLNRTVDNEEYGIFAVLSTGTRVLGNITTGSAEAGIYIGDSPNANALVANNVTSGNLFGIFLRDSMHGTILNNVSQHNCVGALVLGDAPGPAGFYRFLGNRIRSNTRACPASEEGDALSGLGLVISGGVNNIVHGNQITDNVAGGPTAASAGVAVITGDGGTPSTGNVVTGNVITGNDPDILWDGAGSNTLTPNTCGTSVPPGFC